MSHELAQSKGPAIWQGGGTGAAREGSKSTRPRKPMSKSTKNLPQQQPLLKGAGQRGRSVDLAGDPP